MRPRILSILLLSLILPLAGCGGGADQQAGNQQGDANAERPAAPAGQNQGGGGGRRGPKAHVTLTGPLTFDADVAVGCDVFTDKGLQFTLDQSEARAPQVEVRIGDFHGDGEYPGTVVVREHPESGPVREWNGVAKINVESRQVGKAKKRTVFNGTFNGSYDGEGGKGTVAGNFRRCSMKEMLAP
ncbi:MAG TPA: hypothetical protein VKK31_00130 [Thermoanaerobaculia bacterium]|nr:hypothetical protein [Thermoanaerobaculia bacterium]